MKVKDAIVDAFTRKNLPRPNVDRDAPDIRSTGPNAGKETASIALDLSGDGLHLRGYRDRAGIAPIKETPAAAIVMRSGWQPGTLLDPMCGSGTLLIEAAMLATDRAPGLHRGRWGFSGWTQHDEAIWQEVKVKQTAPVKAWRSIAPISTVRTVTHG